MLRQPSAERRKNANIARFIEAVRNGYRAEADDYSSLYRGSIDHPEAFRDLFWDFSKIEAAQALRNDGIAPGDRLFYYTACG
ncbi:MULTISPECIES: hypothetical protein [Methylomicrobium]|uniref:Uncharacterized protein n=1 Tax=Methylomicrobium album BG8 TaxID=686340 RepID=H8GRF5_METAL|nr:MULTISPECIES: hypothetical protein [Methylomicrobium]EIC31134.1 hypothetical protein Metal_3485 [Methylomicrobium album BG8]